MVDQGLPGNPPREVAVKRRLWLLQAGAGVGAAWVGSGWAQDKPALQRIRERGTLLVGVYNEMPPFHAGGQGIDVALAGALAQALGVKLSLLPFNADDNMNDDLRNMVWKGHYLGYGPADVLLHVPVDRPLMVANPQVTIFAPYYRERVMIARSLAAAPKMESLDDLAGKKIAVPGQSLAGWLLIGAESGKYREQLSTTWKDGVAAAEALQRGEVQAAAGHASELESVLAGDVRFAIEPLPVPRMKDGWVVGLAVKKSSDDLAQALQGAINSLASNGALGQMFAAAKVSWRKP